MAELKDGKAAKNAKENPVRQLDNRFVSTKGDSKFRGFGLENVKDVGLK